MPTHSINKVPMVVLDATDAMILGSAARFPEAARPYIERLDQSVREIGRRLVNDSGESHTTQVDSALLDSLRRFGGLVETVRHLRNKSVPAISSRTRKGLSHKVSPRSTTSTKPSSRRGGAVVTSK